MLKRPALGQAASLGSLYDARNDTFVPLSVLKKQPPHGAITKTDIPSSDIKYSRVDTYREKFHNLDIGPSLSASFLAGFFNVDGSGRYLNARRDTNLMVQVSLIFNLTTVNEIISFQADGIEECLSLEALDTDLATHVVAEVVWGSRNVVTVKQSLSHNENTSQITARLDSQLTLLAARFSAGGDFERSDDNVDFDNSFEITIFGDVNANDGIVPTDLAGAARFLSNISKYISNANEGKGKPLTYTLIPISLLSNLLKCQISREITVKQLSIECSEKFVQIFDEIANIRQSLNDYRSLLQNHRDYIPQAHIRAVGDRILEARTAETRLQSQYASTLSDVRAGKADESSLWKVLEGFTTGDTVINGLNPVNYRLYKEKMQLIKGLIAEGAKYIGFNGESLDLELGSFRDVDIFVFHFSEEVRRSSELWKQNISLLHQLLDDESRQARIILRDCDAFEEPLSQSRISLFRNAEEIIEDVLEDRKISAGKCTGRYIRAHLDRSGAPRPTSRIIVKMPCPGPDCSIRTSHDWICAKCNCPIEYGHTDQYIYCDCGRCDYRYWAFRCSNRSHGLDHIKYEDSRFLNILTALEPFDELNILILGRTGVGKSTWINAFTNYLMFPTLDDALNADQLCWIIPFAFRTYNVDSRGEFEDVKVKVGFKDTTDESTAQKVSVEEHDGTAAGSATQKTAVHRVQIGNRLIRLIDTPGIGDTRGASQDKENMADILSVLRSYNKLHGILILLKPNDQRLDLMFKFCVQELLTHLHRDAAKNLAFGFTNTRGTNYMPGDTFDPLRQLLGRFKDVEITLRKHNVYCFDSESFRYLAAQKQHHKSLGHLDENRASWDYSVTESKRLIDYFKSLEPHQVTSTVNLYETRYRIVGMTEPMAAIAETIKATIRLNEDEIQDLSLNEKKKKDLEKLLRVEVKTLKAVLVDRPRTACAHESCVEHSSTGIDGLDGREILKTVYKTLCHNPCYLNGIKLDDVGDKGLKGCWAMNGTEQCRICGHPWMTHLHINYDVQQGTKEINDPEIEDALRRNASFRTKKEAAISAKKRVIADLEYELKKIGDSAAQFSIFLKRNAIMPYNDATLDYLDRHIEDEKAKVQVGGSRDKLDNLKQYRERYEQQVKILDEYIEKGEHHMLLDQAGVEILLQDLYSLKHYGKTLREMRQVVQASQTAVYREKPYVMRAKSHWTGEEEPGYATVTGGAGALTPPGSATNSENGGEVKRGGIRGWLARSFGFD